MDVQGAVPRVSPKLENRAVSSSADAGRCLWFRRAVANCMQAFHRIRAGPGTARISISHFCQPVRKDRRRLPVLA